jgi:hypothetical protein
LLEVDIHLLSEITFSVPAQIECLDASVQLIQEIHGQLPLEARYRTIAHQAIILLEKDCPEEVVNMPVTSFTGSLKHKQIVLQLLELVKEASIDELASCDLVVATDQVEKHLQARARRTETKHLTELIEMPESHAFPSQR